MDFELLKGTRTRYLFLKMLCILALGIGILVVLGKIFKVHLTDSYIEICALIITVLWFLITLKFMKNNNINVYDFVKKPSKKGFALELPVNLIITYMGGMGFILIMLVLVSYINPTMLSSVQSNLVNKSPKINTNFIIGISFMSIVIIVPIVEEFIFRGVLMGRLYNKYGMGKSILFSSVIFFIMHLNINPMLLLLGISCALLVYKYKSLVPSIILHMCNNFITFINGLKSSGGGNNLLNVNSSFMIAGIILFIIYVLYSYRNYRKCKKAF
ncbi:CPBP family intramembrane glutamic endopeptidase [Clostridium sp. 001]|uniref:CPBP family intramembrane glutamic endopeptidase n=1 Tax=Clostridium sp. 001 TaxID=1970093 RepID=UPI001C2CBD8A|nr:CPBP family intramembrane glutamic endopeptidase [Clostridium sp. 001]QXE20718.1 CPBP family intramembrane metalloprotease [Clostridium sp. 001]